MTEAKPPAYQLSAGEKFQAMLHKIDPLVYFDLGDASRIALHKAIGDLRKLEDETPAPKPEERAERVAAIEKAVLGLEVPANASEKLAEELKQAEAADPVDDLTVNAIKASIDRVANYANESIGSVVWKQLNA